MLTGSTKIEKDFTKSAKEHIKREAKGKKWCVWTIRFGGTYEASCESLLTCYIPVLPLLRQENKGEAEMNYCYFCHAEIENNQDICGNCQILHGTL